MTAPPIRPGTARRLGLRPPPPRWLISTSHKMTQAEVDEFAERIRRIGGKAIATAPRRRWWQRGRSR